MMRSFKNIADLEFKFDKIFLLVGNITGDFKLYINGLAKNLVKSESDVIVFKLQSVKSEFYYEENCMCCENFCVCCFGCKSYYNQSSNAIFVNIHTTDNPDCNLDYFINYITNINNIDPNKTIKSEIMFRDEDISNNTIPIVIAKPVTITNTITNTNSNSNINLEPSAPPENTNIS